MTFENITKDTSCNCLDGAIEDTVSTFARVLNKESTTDKDFLSHWEKNHRPTECEEICGKKGVSISKIDNDTVKNEILNYYSSIFKMSPKYRRGVLIFKLKKDAGLVKPTPFTENPYHHDLYKDDAFSLGFVEEVETCYLTAAVV